MSAECLVVLLCFGIYVLEQKCHDIFRVHAATRYQRVHLPQEPEAGSTVNTSSKMTQKACLMCQLCRRKETISQSYLSST